uniref:Uncharacterized protein n=1 Tax=Triticum aestivum TaxID=4565 RepID=F5CPS3_WHEAT|nr:hypothetical protein TAANSRALLha_1144N5.t00003 [Triticum aestivum]
MPSGSSAKEEIIISPGNEKDQPPQQTPDLSEDAVYAVTDAEYEEEMKLMLRRLLLHDLRAWLPLEMLLHAVKPEPQSHPR